MSSNYTYSQIKSICDPEAQSRSIEYVQTLTALIIKLEADYQKLQKQLPQHRPLSTFGEGRYTLITTPMLMPKDLSINKQISALERNINQNKSKLAECKKLFETAQTFKQLKQLAQEAQTEWRKRGKRKAQKLCTVQ